MNLATITAFCLAENLGFIEDSVEFSIIVTDYLLKANSVFEQIQKSHDVALVSIAASIIVGNSTILNTEMGTNSYNPLENVKYSEKVKRQMSKESDRFHGFPKSVDGFGGYGKVTNFRGGDNALYTKVEIFGEYDGFSGVFEYIIDGDGVCNHRLFRPY